MSWVAMGEFGSEAEVLGALARLRDEGWTRWNRLDVHSPYPLDGADEILGLGPSPVRWAALAGAIAGGSGGYAVQWWMNAHDWPLDVGNRPPHSWPAFALLSYEGLILCAALAILLALVAAWRLPDLHHAALGAAGFESATGEAFWVSLDARTPAERDLALAALRGAGAGRVQAVDQEEGRG